jgi:hypothetical protein
MTVNRADWRPWKHEPRNGAYIVEIRIYRLMSGRETTNMYPAQTNPAIPSIFVSVLFDFATKTSSR